MSNSLFSADLLDFGGDSSEVCDAPLRDLLPKNWADFLGAESLRALDLVESRINSSGGFSDICPPKNAIFRSFELTAPESVRAVLLGQDPYHDGSAMGLSFSVLAGRKIPPSLRNIYKEVESSLGFLGAKNGDLSAWAKNGVLLMNAILSVKRGAAMSHKDVGWESFTDAVISALSAQERRIVFIFLGKFAAQKTALISPKHAVLTAPHPSPLAQFGREKFIGSGVFKKAVEILGENLFV